MSDIFPVCQDSADLEDQPETVAEAQLMLFKRKKYCDVTFTFPCLSDKIEAHELSLKARSPVFERMFRKLKSVNTQQNHVIEINGSTPERFKQFLEFIYSDTFEANMVEALELLHLAQRYKVRPLIKKCNELLKNEIQVQDSVKIFETARRYGPRELMDQAGEILIESFLDLARMGALIKVEEETVVYLLECDALSVPDVGLFDFILKWGKNQVGASDDEQTLKDKLKNVIPRIRYTNMSLSEFNKVVVPTGLLSAEEILSVYSYFRGDEVSRKGFKIKFNTVRRKLEIIKKVANFYSGQTGYSQRSYVFSKQCVSFKAERMQQVMPPEWSDFFVKRAVITGIMLMWPHVHGIYKGGTSLNFKISLREVSGTINAESARVQYEEILLNCTEGKVVDISVKPPVALIPERRYSVLVEDSSTYDLSGNFRNDHEAYFGYGFVHPNPEANTDLEDALLTLKEVRRKTDFYEPNIPYESKGLAVILGMRIGLV